MPVGYSASETEFNAVNKTGGDKAVTLTVEQIPSHRHTVAYHDIRLGLGSENVSQVGGSLNTNTGNTGGGKSHSNIQPYKVCYMWQRSA